MNWLEKLASMADLNAIPAEDQKRLRDFMAEFYRVFIPNSMDSEPDKKVKVSVIRLSLPSMERFLKNEKENRSNGR